MLHEPDIARVSRIRTAGKNTFKWLPKACCTTIRQGKLGPIFREWAPWCNISPAWSSTKEALTIVTINRPDVMNALHPAAHYELAEVFDAFAADPRQWVAIVTGPGERALSA